MVPAVIEEDECYPKLVLCSDLKEALNVGDELLWVGIICHVVQKHAQGCEANRVDVSELLVDKG
jgi:hypothetical protein